MFAALIAFCTDCFGCFGRSQNRFGFDASQIIFLFESQPIQEENCIKNDFLATFHRINKNVIGRSCAEFCGKLCYHHFGSPALPLASNAASDLFSHLIELVEQQLCASEMAWGWVVGWPRLPVFDKVLGMVSTTLEHSYEWCLAHFPFCQSWCVAPIMEHIAEATEM